MPVLDCQTQDALARKSGVGQSTVGRIIRGEVDPQVGTMMLLARALRVPFKTLATVAEGEKADEPNDRRLIRVDFDLTGFRYRGRRCIRMPYRLSALPP
jgi:transcriptional regulator with XRE-family HTH domain